jgi:nicotinamidase-related amidase
MNTQLISTVHRIQWVSKAHGKPWFWTSVQHCPTDHANQNGGLLLSATSSNELQNSFPKKQKAKQTNEKPGGSSQLESL